MIDLTTIPDDDLTREYMRRINARRKRAGGRPVVLTPCKFCGQEFGFNDMRVHVPQCKRQAIANVMQYLPSSNKKASRT